MPIGRHGTMPALLTDHFVSPLHFLTVSGCVGFAVLVVWLGVDSCCMRCDPGTLVPWGLACWPRPSQSCSVTHLPWKPGGGWRADAHATRCLTRVLNCSQDGEYWQTDRQTASQRLSTWLQAMWLPAPLDLMKTQCELWGRVWN